MRPGRWTARGGGPGAFPHSRTCVAKSKDTRGKARATVRIPGAAMHRDKTFTIEVWNDFCVPHCYTGETHLLRAIGQLGLEEKISVRLRAFELDPGFPPGKTIDVPRCVAKKYGCSLPEALEKIGAASRMARKADIDMKFASAIFCNTRTAHRVLKFAEKEFGDAKALELNFALLGAYFT